MSTKRTEGNRKISNVTWDFRRNYSIWKVPGKRLKAQRLKAKD